MKFTINHLPDGMHFSSSSLYDSFSYSAGQCLNECLSMFSVPMGINNRTIQDTNMEKGNLLPPPQMFILYGIDIIFSSVATLKDIFILVENGLVELVIMDKRYVQEPIIALSQLGNSDAPIWVCDYCKSVYVGFDCNKCGASEKTLFSPNGLNEIISSNRVWSLDVSQCPITLLSQAYFQLNIFSNSNCVLTSANRGGEGLKFWVRLKGLHGKGLF